MPKNRDDFPARVRVLLFKRSGTLCSNPTCRAHTIGPSSESNTSISDIGIAAHIKAAAEGGPRYDKNQSPEQRSSFDNGIWLCQNCARLIDTDEAKYTVALLHQWKAKAEQHAQDHLGKASPMQLQEQWFRDMLQNIQQPPTATPPTDKVLEELEQVRTLIRAGSHRAAEKKLQQFDATKLQDAQDNTRYLYHALWGNIHSQLGRYDQATVAYTTAYGFAGPQPSVPALTNRAAAAFFQGELDIALTHLDFALRQDEGYDPALGLKAAVLHRQGKPHLLRDLWAKVDPDHPLLLGSLVRLQLEETDRQEVRKHLQDALEQHPDDLGLQTVLARFLVVGLSRMAKTTPHVDVVWTIKTHPDHQEASRILTHLAPEALKMDHPALQLEILSLQQVLHTLTGDLFPALQVGQLALQVAKDEPVIHRNQVQAYSRMGDLEKANAALKLLQEAEEDFMMWMAYVDLLIGQDLFPLALSRLQALQDWPDLTLDDQVIVQLYILRCHLFLNDADQASRVLDENLLNFPEHAYVQVMQAEFCSWQRNLEQAETHYLEAIQGFPDHEKSRVKLQYVQFLKVQKRWEEATTVLQTVVTPLTELDFVDLAVRMAWTAENHPQAMHWICMVEDRGEKPTGFMLRVKGKLLEHTGDLPAAMQVLRRLMSEEPERHELQVELAAQLWQTGQGDASLQELERLLKQPGLPGELHFQVAQLLQKHGHLERAMKVAYQGYRRMRDVPEAHISYLNIAVTSPDLPPPPQSVVEESAVQVETPQGQKRWWTVTQDPEPQRRHGELPPHDGLARQLLGKGVGDTLTVNSAGWTSTTYQVTDIQWKEFRALQDLPFSYQQDFPDAGDLQMGSIENEQGLITLPFGMVQERQKDQHDLLQESREAHLPLATTGRRLGLTPVETWNVFLGDPSQQVDATRGDLQEVKLLLHTQPGPCLLDLGALVVLDHLNLLDQLPSWFPELLVTQHTVTALREHQCRVLYKKSNKHLYVTEGGLPVFHETPPEQVEQEKAQARRLVEFVEHHTQVVPSPGLLHHSPETVRFMEGAAFSALSAAETTGKLFYSDDLYLKRPRGLGAFSNPVQGFSTYSLLLALHLQQKLSFDAYARANFLLMEKNVRFAPLSRDLLRYALMQDGHVWGRHSELFFEHLHAHPCLQAEKVKLLVYSVSHVWLQTRIPLMKEAFLKQCLKVTLPDLPRVLVANLVAQGLEEVLQLAPLHQQDVLKAVWDWVQQE